MLKLVWPFLARKANQVNLACNQLTQTAINIIIIIIIIPQSWAVCDKAGPKACRQAPHV